MSFNIRHTREICGTAQIVFDKCTCYIVYVYYLSQVAHLQILTVYAIVIVIQYQATIILAGANTTRHVWLLVWER